MGRFQTIQPKLGKVRIRPTLMITSAATAFTAHPLAADTPQAAADPAVQLHERRAAAVLEISEPSPQRSIQIVDDHSQRMTVVAFRLRTDRILELVQTLLPRPTPQVALPSGREVIAQKVKA